MVNEDFHANDGNEISVTAGQRVEVFDIFFILNVI